jgi:mitochondrial fission protein ELM1
MAQAMAGRYPVEISPIRLPAWVLPLGKVLQPFWPLGAGLLRGVRPDGAPPDLILGSGGNSLWATAALGHRWRCPAVFIGTRRRLPARALDILVHYDPELAMAGYLLLAVLPGPVGPEVGRLAWEALRQERGLDTNGPYLACLLGGDGSGYTWTEADGELLAEGLQTVARAWGARLLLTTSRRTPPALEAVLRQRLPPEILADACWAGAGDARRVVAAYLHGAQAVLVGEDSMSMIHEALASRHPVATLRPQQATPPAYYLNYVRHAEAEAWLARLSMDAPAHWAAGLRSALGYPGDVAAEAAAALGTRLGWDNAGP